MKDGSKLDLRDDRALMEAAGNVVTVKANLTPKQEAVHIMHELMHATGYALHTGDTTGLKAMRDRWHEFCVRNPEIGKEYGYDHETQIWTVKIDPKLQELIDKGLAPPYRPVVDRNKLN